MNLKNYPFRFLLILVLGLLIALSCSRDEEIPASDYEVTFFIINDVHGKIDHFPKLKALAEAEEQYNAVIIAACGDMFSGNPVVDNHPEKGYPIVDLMNRTGVDIAVLGNHEFDYGQEVLAARMAQSEFPWLCANVNTTASSLPQPPAYTKIKAGETEIVFLGMVETHDKSGIVMPSTHPWKLENLTFSHYDDLLEEFSGLKESENAGLYVFISHLGEYTDLQMLQRYPYFDLVIGGHSHSITDTAINDIPVFHAGSNLYYTGRIRLDIEDNEIAGIDYDLIRMDTVDIADQELEELVQTYNTDANMEEVLGTSAIDHTQNQVGCLYTDALRIQTNMDVVFQNGGGVRAGLDAGDITKKEIYTIDPFGNGFVNYRMTVAEIKYFLMGSGEGLYYSGAELTQKGNEIEITDTEGSVLDDDTEMKVGVNDYIAAVHGHWLPAEYELMNSTTAEIIIEYIRHLDHAVEYPDCKRYFRFRAPE